MSVILSFHVHLRTFYVVSKEEGYFVIFDPVMRTK